MGLVRDEVGFWVVRKICSVNVWKGGRKEGRKMVVRMAYIFRNSGQP